VRDATEAAGRSREINTQAIIDDRFQSDLRPMLLAERFIRSATGLVIILGLLGTFYGLTLSIGKIVHLVGAETTGATDVAQGVSQGLTNALSGMAVAFSNSLVGILSAVILTVLGILSNVSDRRTAVMVQIETYLDRIRVQRQAPAARLTWPDSAPPSRSSTAPSRASSPPCRALPTRPRTFTSSTRTSRTTCRGSA
jgi:hypothetical protein